MMKNKQIQLSRNHLKFDDLLLLKSFWLYSSGILSMAIVFSGLPVRAEGQLHVLHTPQNITSELNSLLNSEPSTEHSTIAHFDKVTSNKEQHQAPVENWIASSEKSVDPAHTLIQVDTLSIEPTNAPTNELTDEFEPADSVIQPVDVEAISIEATSIEATNIEPLELSFPADPIPTDPIAQGIPTPAEELTTPEAGDRWRFSVEPYFFVPVDVDADVTAAGRTASLDLGLGDILNLDRAFDAGLRVEAQRNRLGLILDGFYIYGSDSGRLGGTFSGGSLLEFAQRTSPDRLQQFIQRFDPVRLQQIAQQLGEQQIGLDTPARISANGRISVRQITVDAAVSYQVVDTSLNDSPEETNFYPRLVIAPIVGVRTNSLRQTIEVDTVRIDNLPIPDDRLPVIDDREFRFSRTLVEPMVGAQFGLGLSDRWALGLRGDVSGFNIGADRNLTWNLLAGAQYRLSRLASLQLGYRFNSFEFEDGEGLRRARLNLRQNGLWLSAKFHF
jgi:hypothetical protein